MGTSGLTLLNWIVWFLCLSSVFFYYFSEELISSFFHLNKKIFWYLVFSEVHNFKSQKCACLPGTYSASLNYMFNPIPSRLFLTFERQRGFLARVRKTAIKAVYFTQITWNLVQHIFGLLTKTLLLVMWSRWLRQYFFDGVIIQQPIFGLTFKIFVCLKWRIHQNFSFRVFHEILI